MDDDPAGRSRGAHGSSAALRGALTGHPRVTRALSASEGAAGASFSTGPRADRRHEDLRMRALLVMLVLLFATAVCAVGAWLAGEGPARSVLMFCAFLLGIGFIGGGFLTLAEAVSPIKDAPPAPQKPAGREPRRPGRAA